MRPIELARVDLNLLYTFHRVVVDGGVTAAARALGRTQPAITQRLRQLEAELELRLFERVGRRLVLTAAGRAVARGAEDIVGRAHVLLDQVRAGASAPVGTVRVGALPTVSAYLLAHRIAAFVRATPQVEVEIRTGTVADLLDALRRGELDVMVSVGHVEAARIEVVAIGEVAPVVVLPAGARAPRGPMRASDLARRDIVAFSRGATGDPFFDAIWLFLEHHGLERNARLTVPHIQSIKELIAAGAGVSILPRYTVIEPTLTTRPVRGLETPIPIVVATRRGSAAIPAVEALLARIRAPTRAPRGGRSK